MQTITLCGPQHWLLSILQHNIPPKYRLDHDCHAQKVNPELNNACLIVTGQLRPTPLALRTGRQGSPHQKYEGKFMQVYKSTNRKSIIGPLAQKEDSSQGRALGLSKAFTPTMLHAAILRSRSIGIALWVKLYNVLWNNSQQEQTCQGNIGCRSTEQGLKWVRPPVPYTSGNSSLGASIHVEIQN